MGRFTAEVPDDLAYVEPYRRRVRGISGGHVVIDSDRVLLVHRPAMPWFSYAFPEDDVDDSVTAKPSSEVPGYLRVRWDAMDQWIEEDEPVVGPYARNPYHRVDCARSSRRLTVEVAGTTLVDTTDTVAVFETTLEPRLYVERELVRMDLLVPSATTSFCGFKGHASYWDAVVDGVVMNDVAWSYEDPLPTSGCELIRGRLAFDNDRAKVDDHFPEVLMPHVPTRGA